MNFAENLRAIRKEKGMSQAEFTEFLNMNGVSVTQPSIANYELCVKTPNLKTFFAMAAALNVSPEQLYGTNEKRDI